MKLTKKSFYSLATEWLADRKAVWTRSHINTIELRFENDVFPHIGSRQASKISSAELLDLLRRIESRGANETAHRVCTNISRIFQYAMRKDELISDPTLEIEDKLQPVTSKKFSAITDPVRFGQVLSMFDEYESGIINKAAMKFAPLVFVRPHELRHAEWKDIDFDKAEWEFFATKTKTNHIVPLSTQSIKILRELYPITGTSKYVFPNPRNFELPLPEGALIAGLRAVGIAKDEMSAQGFRMSARAMLDKQLKFSSQIIDLQMAKVVRNTLDRSCKRTKHLSKRKEMMQQWADYLDGLKRYESIEIDSWETWNV